MNLKCLLYLLLQPVSLKHLEEFLPVGKAMMLLNKLGGEGSNKWTRELSL